MQYVSRTFHIKSLTHKKCLREKYVIINPNFFEVDKILSDYVERNKKNFDLSLLYFEFKLDLNNNFNPHIRREYFYITSNISMKKYLFYWIECFMSRGYKFFKINEVILQNTSDRRDMTYEHYLNQPMSMCERKINMNIARNPHLINS